MAISKLILNGITQMDVTQNTVTADTLLLNETATKANGLQVIGNYIPNEKPKNVNFIDYDGTPTNWSDRANYIYEEPNL